MGIHIEHPATARSEPVFHKLDYQIMAMAFELHNSMGNLWDEADYKKILRQKCIEQGFETHEEVQLTATHGAFRKSYFIDLLIEGVIYELKTIATIVPANESQTLNYLFLSNTQHGKIINFRPNSLEWRFVSSAQTAETRQRYDLFVDKHTDRTVSDILEDILNDWGAYLSIQLYKEALLFFLNQPLESAHSRFIPLSETHLLHITGLSRGESIHEKSLHKYLNKSNAQQIDWINFDKNQITIRSLGKKSFCP